jgi:hypothetical protein
MLDAIPDQRPTLRAAAPEELSEIFEAFDVNGAYDKPNRTLTLAATVAHTAARHLPQNDESRLARGGFRIAGAGFEPATFGL